MTTRTSRANIKKVPHYKKEQVKILESKGIITEVLKIFKNGSKGNSGWENKKKNYKLEDK